MVWIELVELGLKDALIFPDLLQPGVFDLCCMTIGHGFYDLYWRVEKYVNYSRLIGCFASFVSFTIILKSTFFERFRVPLCVKREKRNLT